MKMQGNHLSPVCRLIQIVLIAQVMDQHAVIVRKVEAICWHCNALSCAAGS